MKTNRANWLQKIRISAAIIWVTVWHCSAVIIKGLNRATPRATFDAIIRTWAYKLLDIIQLKVDIVGSENVHFEDGKCYIIMCNHTSHYDIPLCFKVLPGSIRMMAKKELFRIPIFGRAIQRVDTVSIDRSNREQARKDLENARQTMASGIRLWIAPEGTRSRNGKLLPFKQGGFRLAIDAKAVIIPLGVIGLDKVLPADTLDWHIKQTVLCRIGTPIDASQYAFDQRKKLMADVEQEIRRLTEQENPHETND